MGAINPTQSLSCMKCDQSGIYGSPNKQNGDNTELCFYQDFQQHPRGNISHESIKYLQTEEQNFLKSCSSQNISAIRYYLRQGVNINILDQERTSPLHIAARFASPSVVEELLNSGSNIDITDSAGWTPLHIASYYSRVQVCKILKQFGARDDIQNKDGKLAQNLTNNLDILLILSERVSDVKYPQFDSGGVFQGGLQNYFTQSNNITHESHAKIPMHLNTKQHKYYLFYQNLKNQKLQGGADFQNQTNIYQLAQSPIKLGSKQRVSLNDSSQNCSQVENLVRNLMDERFQSQNKRESQILENLTISQIEFEKEFKSLKELVEQQDEQNRKRFLIWENVKGKSQFQCSQENESIIQICTLIFNFDVILGIALLTLFGIITQEILSLTQFILRFSNSLDKNQIGVLISESILRERKRLVKYFILSQQLFENESENDQNENPNFQLSQKEKMHQFIIEEEIGQIKKKKKEILNVSGEEDSDEFIESSRQQCNKQIQTQHLKIIPIMRNLFKNFQIKNEPVIFDQILEPFANIYFQKSPPNFFANSDSVHLLSFASLILDVDIHLNKNKNYKESYNEFESSLVAVNNGQSFSQEYIKQIFDLIVSKPILQINEIQPEIATQKSVQKIQEFLFSKFTIQQVQLDRKSQYKNKLFSLHLVDSFIFLQSYQAPQNKHSTEKKFNKKEWIQIFSILQLRVKKNDKTISLSPNKKQYIQLAKFYNDHIQIKNKHKIVIQFSNQNECNAFEVTIRQTFLSKSHLDIQDSNE